MPRATSARRERRWLTPQQAAAYVHVSTHTLRHLEARGEGPPVHRPHPRIVRYDANELDEWIAGRGRQ